MTDGRFPQENRLKQDNAQARRAATDQAIRTYALAVAGTEQDLDPAFEAAGVEFWVLSSEEESQPDPA
jgi:hypothetical protein